MSQFSSMEGKFKPRRTWLHVRFLLPADRTEGGLWLPECCQVNWSEAEVLAAGPQATIVCAGDTVLFERTAVEVLAGHEREGIVKEENLLAITYADGMICPLNDWVLVSLEAPRATDDKGFVIPEEYRRRPRYGRIEGLGPGRQVTKPGPYHGNRLSVCSILGVDPDMSLLDLDGVVHWSPDAVVIELGREHVEWLLIRAGDLDVIEILDETQAEGAN